MVNAISLIMMQKGIIHCAEVMAGRIREVAKKLGGAGAAARAAQEVEEAIRARQKSVIAAKESVGDGEKGGGGGAQGA